MTVMRLSYDRYTGAVYSAGQPLDLTLLQRYEHMFDPATEPTHQAP